MQAGLCRPFLDQEMFRTSQEIDFYTDASRKIGFGCYFNKRWAFGSWMKKLLNMRPSIEFLELFALCAGILTWEQLLRDVRIVIFCDNQVVVEMVNNTTSSCAGCMQLLRVRVLNNLQFNRRISVRYVRSSQNILADSLSRNKLSTFWKHAPRDVNSSCDVVPECLFPIERFLQYESLHNY